VTAPADQFVDAIRNGEPRAVEAVERLLMDMRDIDDITANDLEVLQLLSRGLTASEAGRVLFLSTDAVKSRTKLVRAKLGARNTAHAVAIALREGMIQ